MPMNNKENYAIWNVAKQKSLTHPFIGLVRHSDTKFYTVEGVKPSYTNWAPGEPNSPNSEHCGHFWNNKGQWNDIPCSHNFNFICQQPLKCKYKHTNIISLEANVNLSIIYICAMYIDLILYYISFFIIFATQITSPAIKIKSRYLFTSHFSKYLRPHNYNYSTVHANLKSQSCITSSLLHSLNVGQL